MNVDGDEGGVHGVARAGPKKGIGFPRLPWLQLR